MDALLIGVGDGADRGREREDHVVVLDRQEIGLPLLQPALTRAALALRAVTIKAAAVLCTLINANDYLKSRPRIE
jgi:hypothetical protein